MQFPDGPRDLGLLTTTEALLPRAQGGLGLTHRALRWRVDSGRWQRLHSGVYLMSSGPVDWITRAVPRCWLMEMPRPCVTAAPGTSTGWSTTPERSSTCSSRAPLGRTSTGAPSCIGQAGVRSSRPGRPGRHTRQPSWTWPRAHGSMTWPACWRRPYGPGGPPRLESVWRCSACVPTRSGCCSWTCWGRHRRARLGRWSSGSSAMCCVGMRSRWAWGSSRPLGWGLPLARMSRVWRGRSLLAGRPTTAPRIGAVSTGRSPGIGCSSS